jgi:hypothetical protein
VTTKKPKQAEAAKPAFVVADAAHTDFTGLTKNDWFSGFVLLGIFAGPAGRDILDSHDDAVLVSAADLARRMGDVMASRSAA